MARVENRYSKEIRTLDKFAFHQSKTDSMKNSDYSEISSQMDKKGVTKINTQNQTLNLKDLEMKNNDKIISIPNLEPVLQPFYDTYETSRKRRRSVDLDEEEILLTNKKAKIQIQTKDKLNNLSEKDNYSHSQSMNVEELNDKNIWKKDKRIRREYFCKTCPTLVITPINGKLLKSQTAVVKMFGRSSQKIVQMLKAHSFSSTMKTIYIHFQSQVRLEELKIIAEKFNDYQQSQLQMQDKPDSKDENLNDALQRRRIPKCVIFSTTYVADQKAQRSKDMYNPEINHFVLLRNVSLRETEIEIKETLQEMNLRVEKVERFKGLPLVKVQLSTSEDVIRALQGKEFFIGYNMVTCEPFDKFRSRPRSHFIQCRKCFGLNHLAKDCSKKKVCKYCGMYNHSTEQCYKKGYPGKYKCVLCKGKHPSDSILCPVIQKIRATIGINLSRREKKIIDKKEAVQKSLQGTESKIQNRNSIVNLQLQRYQPNQTISEQSNIVIVPQKESSKMSYRDKTAPQQQADKQTKIQIQEQETRNKPRTQQNRPRNINRQTRQEQIPRNEQEQKRLESRAQNDTTNEILQLRQEMADLKNTVQSLLEFIQDLRPLIQGQKQRQNNPPIFSQETRSMEYKQ